MARSSRARERFSQSIYRACDAELHLGKPFHVATDDAVFHFHCAFVGGSGGLDVSIFFVGTSQVLKIANGFPGFRTAFARVDPQGALQAALSVFVGAPGATEDACVGQDGTGFEMLFAEGAFMELDGFFESGNSIIALKVARYGRRKVVTFRHSFSATSSRITG
jgi:hypothetical protein